MDTLKALIQNVDDDYLIGLSNKGTVKRANKDLEQETPVLTWQGEEAQVALKEETCVIRAPLGESKCSCPSRSICRHIVTAVLWMKKEMGRENEENPAGQTDDRQETEAVLEESHSTLEEILAFPVERLKRACGTRRYGQLLAHIRAGELPPMEESSIITVVLPWENATVKLLEPFVYSTCTCHSKELCAHKAQAALAYQIKKGKLSLKDLESQQETETVWDITQLKQTCTTVCEELCHQLCTGLSRQSPEASESLERLAVITHRAGLPKLETSLRQAASDYQQYFARSAAFRNEELLQNLLDIWKRAKRLSHAETQEEIRLLAGTFRDTYEFAGKLHLMGMGGRTFSSKTGYEGEIYYFLETGKKEWYTWTDARPVFYEGTRRRPPANSENAPAPWSLNCSREQMQTLEFDLKNAKAASGGRLSVSQETKAEITGVRSLNKEEVRQTIWWDYEALLTEYFSGGKKDNTAGRQECLALVGAVRWGETSFDTIEQRFSWSLYDQMGRKLFISLKYTKEERLTINFLERLEQKLRKRTQGSIVVFGSVYIDEGGSLCLFPIEFFLQEAEGLLPEIKESLPEKRAVPSVEILNTMFQYHREASHQLSDLFASGLFSVQEETLSQLSLLAEEGERLGLHQAGADFARIAELLKGKRHQMEFSPEPVLEAMERLDAYLQACREKLSYDTAFLSMKEDGSCAGTDTGKRQIRDK